MIEKLRSMAIFAAVVDQTSFRGAAQKLGLAPSRVSEVVSSLEAELGVTLLYRTTRQISLTHEGRLLYEKTQEMLEAAELGLDAISSVSKEPSGSLRVSAPAFVAQTHVMEAFSKFADKYPHVDLTFDFSDEATNLIKDGYDVAIKAGRLTESELLSRKIATTQRILVASPSYASTKEIPSRPEDVEAWDWVGFVMRSGPTLMTGPGGEKVSINGKTRVMVNSVEALYEFTSHGLGVTAIPEHFARRGFERGDLVHILPDWSLSQIGLYALWPNQSRRENLTTLFVRFLAREA